MNLTRRERQVLELLCEGLFTKQVGAKLGVSDRTIDTHRTNLLRKAGAKNPFQLGMWAQRNGFGPQGSTQTHISSTKWIAQSLDGCQIGGTP